VKNAGNGALAFRLIAQEARLRASRNNPQAEQAQGRPFPHPMEFGPVGYGHNPLNLDRKKSIQGRLGTTNARPLTLPESEPAATILDFQREEQDRTTASG
jgi:hypothetical protein